MSEIAFKPLTAIENIFKSLVWDNVVSTYTAYVFVQVPFLNVPVIRELTAYLIKTVSDGFFSVGRLFTDMTAIKIIEPILLDKYQKESIRLSIIAHNSGIDSEEFKKEKEIEKQNFHNFIHFGAAVRMSNTGSKR